MINRWPDKYIVGLTGNIATGKSVVLKMAAEQGALTLDADQIVHQILDGDHFVQEAVVARFGQGSQLPDGRIDRVAVAAIVFNEAEALADLEQILHPAVRRRLIAQIDLSPNQIVFIEAIKLLEGELVNICEEVWVTRCSREIQIERLITFRGMDRDMAITRVNAQLPQSLKVAQANVVIDTGGTLSDTETYFNLAWLGLMRRARFTWSGPDEEAQSNGSTDQVSVDQIPTGQPESPQIIESQSSSVSGFLEEDPALAGISVRRAQLSDVAQVANLISEATNGAVEMAQSELRLALGERGYLIAQKEDSAVAVAGWSAENLIATIDQLFVYPLDAARNFGGALLQEIERTANELICEVILAFPRGKDPDEIHHLLIKWGFTYVDPSSLPHNWQTAVSEIGSENSLVMVKILRDTRQTHIRFLNRVQDLRSP